MKETATPIDCKTNKTKVIYDQTIHPPFYELGLVEAQHKLVTEYTNDIKDHLLDSAWDAAVEVRMDGEDLQEKFESIFADFKMHIKKFK